MSGTNSTTTPAPGNELWFTKGTKRFERIGDTLVLVTEGARITVQLGDITRVSVVVTEPNVVVNKSTRVRARTTDNPPTPKPAARKRAAVKPAAAKPAAAKA